MKVLFITHYSGMGGASVALLSLIDGLKKHNIDACVLIPYDGDLTKELDKRGIVYTKIPFWAGVVNRSFKNSSFFALRRFVNLCRQFYTAIYASYYAKKWDVDIIHANSTYVICGALTGFFSRKPSVWHLREEIGGQFDSVFFHPEWVMKLMARNTDCIIAVSDYVKKYYEPILLGKNKHIVTVYDGAGVHVQRTESNLHQPVNIAYCGGRSINKGWTDTYLLYQGLKKIGFEDYRIWMIGFKQQELLQYIDEMGWDRLFLEKIQVRESMNKFEFDAFRVKMDIMFQPSAAEAFGLVTAEAMLIGLPVVAIQSGASKELIEEGVSGFFYQKGDAAGMAQKVIQLIEDADLREQIIENARKWVTKHCSIEANISQILSLYEQIICR